MSDYDAIVPEWDEVEENDAAEPDDAEIEHAATVGDVAALDDSSETQETE